MIYKLEKLEANGGCVLDSFHLVSFLVLFVLGELGKLIVGAKGLGTTQRDRGLNFFRFVMMSLLKWRLLWSRALVHMLIKLCFLPGLVLPVDGVMYGHLFVSFPCIGWQICYFSATSPFQCLSNRHNGTFHSS